VAQRMGLGQFFVDNAMIAAGRFTGGPAKVSVVALSLLPSLERFRVHLLPIRSVLDH